MSFWEKNPNEIQKIFHHKVKETITLCDNFSNAANKMFNPEIKNVSTHVHLKSEYLKKDSKNYVVPYVSFRRETILILYHSSYGSLSVSLKLFPTPCRGVFFNLYLLVHNLKESCIIHQLGIGYLPLARERIAHFPFYANVKLILGCSRKFNFGRVHQGKCQIRMDLIYIMQERNYFTLPYIESFDNNYVQFHHKSSCSYQLGCRDSPENVVLRGQNYFQMSMKTSKYGSSIHKLSVNVNLVDPIKKYNRNSREENFNLVFRPSSKSFVSVILKSERSENTNRIKVLTGVSLLDEKCVICLREPMQQPLKNDMLIELSVQGQFEMSNCVLGQIKIKSYLCLSEDYHTGNKLIKTFYHVPNCAPGQSNRGKDRLIWTSNLSTKLVSQSGGYVFIFVPGKILEPLFHNVTNDCCITSPCYLKYRWNYYGKHRIPFFQHFYMGQYMIAGLHLLISREETEEPFKRTWTEANETCRRLGTNLPSFVSQEDIKNFFVFLNYFDRLTMLTPIFIGIHKKVISSIFKKLK